MGLLWGSCKGCLEADKHILRLQADRADDKDFIIQLLKQNQELVDKVLALTSPVALREYRRDPKSEEKPTSGPPRPRFPGLNPPRRPPGAHVYDAPGREEAENTLDSAIRKMNG
jgi:hypothetical protein